MATQGNAPCRILLLEPDAELSTQLVLTLRRRLPANTLLRTAASLQEASIWTCMEHFHAALVADMLPDGLGAEFLAKLASRHGQSICLFLLVGGNPNESKAVELLQAYPDVRYIEKPYLPEDLAEIVVRALTPSRKDQTFFGLRLFDLVQAFSLARRSVTLHILMPDGTLGALAIREGSLIHAAIDQCEGTDALVRIARKRQGEIRIERSCTTAKHTIQQPTQQVLVDVFRQLDETVHNWPLKPTKQDIDSEIDTLFDRAFDDNTQ